MIDQDLNADDSVSLAYADKGIWIFVGIDLAIFGLFFLVFLIEKKTDPNVFLQSQLLLNEAIGFGNTIILITSSWLLVKSLKVMLTNTDKSRFFMMGSIAFGLLFAIIKMYEYGEKFSADINIVTNTFFTFYFLLTFIHLCHVIGGGIALTIVCRWLGQRDSAEVKSVTESVGIYWHMVDLLWIFLFLIIYLLR